MKERLYLIAPLGSMDCVGGAGSINYPMIDPNGEAFILTLTEAQKNDGTASTQLAQLMSQGYQLTGEALEIGCINTSSWDGLSVTDLQQFAGVQQMREYAAAHGETLKGFTTVQAVNAYVGGVNDPPTSPNAATNTETQHIANVKGATGMGACGSCAGSASNPDDGTVYETSPTTGLPQNVAAPASFLSLQGLERGFQSLETQPALLLLVVVLFVWAVLQVAKASL